MVNPVLVDITSPTNHYVSYNYYLRKNTSIFFPKLTFSLYMYRAT